MTDPKEQTTPSTAQPEPPPPLIPSVVAQLRAAPITTLLIAINAVVFLVAEHGPRSTLETSTLLRFGASEQSHVRAGEYWRLVTPMFLHIGWGHFLWNNYFSFKWCAQIEEALGKARFLLVYLLSGIGGTAASVACHQAVSAGASGAVFGIVGCTLVLRRRMLPSWRATWEDPPARSILIGAGIWLAIGLTPLLNMDNYAHLGGLLVGGAITWLLTTRPTPVKAWAFSAAGLLALIVAAARPGWSTAAQSEALFEWAAVYYQGKPVAKDEQRAARFAAKACRDGNNDACGLLGWLEYSGSGVPADPRGGLTRLRNACSAGSERACSMVEDEPPQ